MTEMEHSLILAFTIVVNGIPLLLTDTTQEKQWKDGIIQTKVLLFKQRTILVMLVATLNSFIFF